MIKAAGIASALLYNLTSNLPTPSFEQQLILYSMQGLLNRDQASLFYDVGRADFDWPGAEAEWVHLLESDGRVAWQLVDGGLCELVEATGKRRSSQWQAVRYAANDGIGPYLAMTVAGLEGLLPISEEFARSTPCLSAERVPVAYDLRDKYPAGDKYAGLRWGMETLLPRCSKSVLFNANNFTNAAPFARNVTILSADFPIANRAFITNLNPLDTDNQTCTDCDTGYYRRIVRSRDPLVRVFGWSDPESSYTNITSQEGGDIYCTFASPNLSFWAKLKRASSGPLVLPHNDPGTQLSGSKTYVMFQTNEGDTPRILTSFMARGWISERRGNAPVAWGIDPALADDFPALFEHYVSTASGNDTFVAGVAGVGYVFLDAMLPSARVLYEKKAGAALASHGPDVIDTYGHGSPAVLQEYLENARAGGRGPVAFVSQPGPASQFGRASGVTYLKVGAGQAPVPVVQTSRDPRLFYYLSELNQTDPAGDLSSRIRAVADAQAPTPSGARFITVYGGLSAIGSDDDHSIPFFPLVENVTARLNASFEVVGAQAYARLASEAGRGSL